MEIVKKVEGSKVTLSINGRLDTTTAPELDKELESLAGSVKDLVFDLEKTQYISSAGLRVILSTQKAMSKVGSLTLINVSGDIKELFDMTGFSTFLNIK